MQTEFADERRIFAASSVLRLHLMLGWGCLGYTLPPKHLRLNRLLQKPGVECANVYTRLHVVET